MDFTNIYLHNTFTNKKEAFVPINNDVINMYCCGVTVYDDCHLGHARTCLIWDVVRCYLEWKGYKVNYVQNFTDIDDKIIRKALDEKVSIQEISDRYINSFFEDMDALGIRRANLYPRATQSIDRIKTIIDYLLDNNLAYEVEGDIYFSVDKYDKYGLLSNRKLEDLLIGESNRLTEYELINKRNPLDFVLWKGNETNSTSSFIFEWGNGRPGWHIECSAIINKFIGDTVDIHVGGNDLIFPHHENEIAQSTSYTSLPLANYWLHNGMVKIDGRKMSKSIGNFLPIKAYLNQYHPMSIRLLTLQTHYSKPLNYSDEALKNCSATWEYLSKALSYANNIALVKNKTIPKLREIEEVLDYDKDSLNAFENAMNDNFNTPQALAIILNLSKKINKHLNQSIHGVIEDSLSEEILLKLSNTLLHITKPLGLTLSNKELDISNLETPNISDTEIDKLISKRDEARANTNYSEADKIRDLLYSQGIRLVDTDKGTKWFCY